MGKFKINRSLQDAVAILKEHNFLGLAPPRYLITDTASNVLEIHRCSNVSKLILPNVPEASPEAYAMFKDLDALVQASTLQKTGDKADNFIPYVYFNY